MDTGFLISLFLLRVFSFSLYIIIFMYSLGFAKIGGMFKPDFLNFGCGGCTGISLRGDWSWKVCR